MAQPDLEGNRAYSSFFKGRNRWDPYQGYGSTNQGQMDWMREGMSRGQDMAGTGYAGQQQSLAAYQAMAAGQGPSLATNLARQQTGQNIAAQQAMMAQGRGGAAAGQQRSAALAGQGLQAQSAADVANIRAQEQQAAMAGAAGVAGQIAGQGLQSELGYAGNLNQAQVAQMQDMTQFQLGQRALQQQERMGRFQRNFGWANLGRQWIGDVVSGIEGGMSGGAMSDIRNKHDVRPAGTMETPGLRSEVNEAMMSRPEDSYKRISPADIQQGLRGGLNSMQGTPYAGPGAMQPMSPVQVAPMPQAPMLGADMISQGGSGLASGVSPEDTQPAVGALSDERAKHGIEGADMSASELAGAMHPVSFEYNPGSGPPGRRVGVVAQDLEQTPAGRALVVDTPQGKMIDTPQATNAALAMVADQEQRLRRLEGGGQPTAGGNPWANLDGAPAASRSRGVDHLTDVARQAWGRLPEDWRVNDQGHKQMRDQQKITHLNAQRLRLSGMSPNESFAEEQRLMLMIQQKIAERQAARAMAGRHLDEKDKVSPAYEVRGPSNTIHPPKASAERGSGSGARYRSKSVRGV